MECERLSSANRDPMTPLRCFLFGLVATLAGTPALALSLDGDFDHGSLQSWSGNTSVVQLTPRDNFYGGGTWRWLYFKADGVQGANTQFQITDNFALGGSRLDGHKMMYSYDNENWEFFDNNTRFGGLYLFGNGAAFTQDEVWVAYAQPYSYGRSADHTAEVLQSPWASPTASADANGVIGFSPGGIDDLGRSSPSLPMYGYRITNPATDDLPGSGVKKRRVVISSGLHAGEVLGSHAMEGMVDWLISDDPRAAVLRNRAEFFVYPVLNPDGRYAGYARSTVQNPNIDPNSGNWDPSQWGDKDDIRVSGEAMIADVNVSQDGPIDAFIDFHSTVPSPGGDDFGFIEIDQGDHLVGWWQTLLDLQPNVGQVDSTSTGSTTANFSERYLGAEVDVTFETMHGRNRPVEYYLQLGEKFGIAFHDDWGELWGDYNGDGAVNAADYTVWRDNWPTFAPGAAGDSPGDTDLFTGNADYDHWAADYGLFEPGAIGTNAVPEPTAALLMAVGSLACCFGRIR